MDRIQRPSYAQRWKVGLGLNMIVMAACFGLYELGFFGRVDGPLSMTNIGRSLSGIGFTSQRFPGAARDPVRPRPDLELGR